MSTLVARPGLTGLDVLASHAESAPRRAIWCGPHRRGDLHDKARSIFRHRKSNLFISLLALLIATSSSAYALHTLRAGEVHTKHLAKGAVTTPKLAQGAMTSPKVKNLSLRLIDLGGRVGKAATVPPFQKCS